MTEKNESRSRTSGLGGVLKSFKKSLNPASGRVPVVINAKVVGGGPDLQNLLYQLKRGTLSESVCAAVELTRTLQTYSVSSIPEIWYLAREMCDGKYGMATRRVAVNLMVRCIEHDSADVSSRLMYYRDITSYCVVSDTSLDPGVDMFFRALVVLTDNGKEIHDFCVYDYNKNTNWTQFMGVMLRSLCYNLKGREPEMLSLIVEVGTYLRNCFKYNSLVMDHSFLLSVLDSVISISERTREPHVLLCLCELVQTISLFAYIPHESHASIVLYLCSLAPLSESLQNSAWNTISGIFKDMPLETLDVVSSIFDAPDLHNGEVSFGEDSVADKEAWEDRERHHTSVSLVIGCLGFVEEMLLMCGSDQISDSFNFSYQPLYRGVVQLTRLNISKINTALLRMFDRLIALDKENEHRSSQLHFSALFPFQTWYASSGSIISLLLKLKMLTTQDETYWTSICRSLHERMTLTELLAPKDRIVDLFLRHPHLLMVKEATMVLEHYRENNLCVVFDPEWKQNCRTILSSFFLPKRGRESLGVRLHALQVLKDGLEKSRTLSSDDSIGPSCISFILSSNLADDCDEVISYFLHTLVYDTLQASSFTSFRSILVSLECAIKGNDATSSDSSSHKSPVASGENDTEILASKQGFSHEMAKLFGCLLVETSITDPHKFQELYQFSTTLVSDFLEKGLFQDSLPIIKAIVRLRCTYEGFIYFCDPTDINGLATTLKRNSADETFLPNDSHWWTFPEELSYLPKKQFNNPNNRILNCPQDTLLKCNVVTIDLSKWLFIVTTILNECPHWELYSYTLVHLCSQLFNLSLFWPLPKQILKIQEIVCEQIMLKFPQALTFPPHRNINKSDLQVALVRVLSSLIGYHGLFEKRHEDTLVKTLLFGLDSWSKTAIPCIQMLTICCYEIPDSLKRFLVPILTKLQTGVTSVVASASALDFLMALIHVPSLISYFTDDEYRQVFTICFRYIGHSLDAIQRGFDENGDAQQSRYLEHGADAELENKASTQKTVLTPILYQYLLISSYALIVRLFLKIEVTERSRVSSFIIKNILSCKGVKNIHQLDELTIAYIDVITRFTYSNIPLTLFRKSRSNQNPSVSRWLVGHSIVEIDTDPENGNSKITLRRPCDLSIFDLTLNQSMTPKDMGSHSKNTLMLSSHLLLQLFRPLDQGATSKPIALLDDAYTERAINAFDHLPVVAHHKAGVIYMGPGQTEEAEILANTHGSRDYHRFLDGLGEMVTLKSCNSIYVGGLDKENGIDGEYAYFWNDELTHLIFHTTTMMPNDGNCAMKKRHIGNNHVNVFFDESGLPFNFNIIKSQFNFLNIVVSPHTISQIGTCSQPQKFYKVITYRRNGVPGVFSTTHFKLISLEQLPHLVRNLVIMSDRFSDIWHNSVDGVYTTSWQLRVRHIDTLRTKTVEMQKSAQKDLVAPNLRANSKNTTISFLEQLQPHMMETGRLEEPEDQVTGLEQDPYSFLEFNSYT